MGFWTWLKGSHAGEKPNANPPTSVGPPGYVPGDARGVQWDPLPTLAQRSFDRLSPSPWSGWPAEWRTPDWMSKASPLVDTAWGCLDLNSSILSTMPTLRLRKGEVLSALPWMQNPDPNVYESWAEFAKQLFWDYQTGEAFVYSMRRSPSTGMPLAMRVVPPYMVQVDLVGYGERRYSIGGVPIDDPADILHIRYRSDPTQARGCGPLEAGGARVVAAGLIMKLVTTIAQQGGLPPYFLTTEMNLTREQANDNLDEWVDSRIQRAGRPALLTRGVKPANLQTSVKELALTELGQWNESRIAVLLGVPPFLAGLPSGGDSMTYSNVSQLFDFHDRSSLRTKAVAVMSALSNWALVSGQSIELNSDQYTRPGLFERSQAYKNLTDVGAIGPEEIRILERLHGDTPAPAATLGGGDGA